MISRIHRLQLGACAIAVAAAMTSAHAAEITVSTLSDGILVDPRCTLREAIIAANTDTAFAGCPAGSGDDVILLAFTGNHELNTSGTGEDLAQTGDLDVLWNTTIRPLDEGVVVTIDGLSLDRVFHVQDAASLTLERIRVVGGETSSNGAGILVDHPMSELRLIDSEVTANEAIGNGGGIHSVAPVTLERSIISSNDANSGGGVYMDTARTLAIFDTWVEDNFAESDGGGLNLVTLYSENSSIEDNSAHGDGGGIAWRQAAENPGLVSHVFNTTISKNGSSGNGGGLHIDSNRRVEISSATVAWNGCDIDQSNDGDGCGIFVANGTVNMRNSIVAANEDLSPAGPQVPDCSGTIDSDGYNLLGAAAATPCTITGTSAGNIIGSIASPVDPRLNCTSNNGGLTRSVRPEPDSPVIDAGNPAGCLDGFGNELLTDQRGFLRPWDGPDPDDLPRCDIGALELDGFDPSDIIFASNFEAGSSSLTAKGGDDSCFGGGPKRFR